MLEETTAALNALPAGATGRVRAERAVVPRRVLIVHNAYQLRGGEDAVVEAEAALLQSHGLAVERYGRHNDELAGMSRWRAAAESVWSRRSERAVEELIARFRPDVMHVHNTFAVLSPSVLWAARRHGVAVVQTLHNFRLLCPQAMFLREGAPCEDCLGRAPWRAVVHGCYRDSRSQTLVLAGSLMAHRWMGTYARAVHRFIALSEFSRGKFVQAGLPPERIVVKPNFVDAPPLEAAGGRTGYLFVGRLSEEKGVHTLVQAARAAPQVRIDVAGTGPLDGLVTGCSALRPLGALRGSEVLERMRRARALLLTSICYENFPRTIVEAYACGLPVIASRRGAMAELVEHGVTGLLFEPADVGDLVRCLVWAEAHPDELERMGQAARRRYEERYTGAVNFDALLRIYKDAILDATHPAISR